MAVKFCPLRIILMNYSINKKFNWKSSQLACRFSSSLAFVPNPSVSRVKHENSTFSNPFVFLRDYNFSGLHSARNTKILHAHLLKTHDLQSNIFFMNSLLDWYCKSADMVTAYRLFDTIALPNLVSLNIMISGYDHNSMFEKSLDMFCRMHLLGVEPDEFSYGSVLSACNALHAPIFGKQVYSLVIKNGFVSSGYVQTRMMDLFSKNCNFEEALRFFYGASCDNVPCWNAIISVAVKSGESWVALNLFRQMCHASLMPNSYTFPSILTACCVLREMNIGKGIHGLVIKCGATDVFVETAIVDLYAKFGCMSEAFRQFSQMQVHNVVSWTAIISGFVQEDDIIFALKLFKDMRKIGQEINNYTVTSVLSACAKPGMIEEASQIHSLVLKLGLNLDAKVGAALVNMYAKIGAVGPSELAFSEIKNKTDQSIWAAMLSSFAQNQNSGRAVELFCVMFAEGVKPDEYCISSLLSIMSCLNLGSQIHGYTLKSGLVTDVSVGCSLLTMYSKCGCLEESYEVFLQVPVKDNVSWASMISGFAEHGYADRALQLFKEMLYQEIVADNITLISTLKACTDLCFLKIGKEIHGYVFRLGMGTDTVVGGAIVNMYSKCGSLNLARMVFDMLPQKDAFACSSLVSGYAQNGLIEESFSLFHDMLLTNVTVDAFTISSILGVTAVLCRSDIGTQLHAYIEKLGLQADVSIGSSLVTMYSKCGSIEDCRKAFDDADKPDLIGWTSIIVSYARHGKGAEALAAYELMRKGVQPDAVTFVGILLACSHSGLVEEAFFYLNSMFKDYNIKPGHRHYACIVDLLGRSGRLREAESFINKMPIEPDSLIWGTLLAACKVHGDFELGKLAAKKLMELGPGDAGAYVSFSNICADVGQWEEVTKIRSLLKGTGMKKEPGWSLL